MRKWNSTLRRRLRNCKADGMTPECARAEARRRFGNVGLKHEESREIWIKRFWSELGQDVRYGCRTMAANKAFSILAVLLLALGIGANTAVYSFMESILLRSLPVADPESLVVLNWHSPPPFNASKQWAHVMHGLQGLMWPGNKGVMASGIFPYPAFETLRAENPVFSTLFGYFNGLHHNLSIHGQAATSASAGVRHRRVFSRPGSVARRGTSDRLRRRPSRRTAGRRHQFCYQPKSLWRTAECDWTLDSRR